MASEAAAAPRTTDLLPRRRILGYAMGDVANNVAFQMTSLFLMVYMTDIAGVSAGIAGAIYGVTKVWAGVTDLVAAATPSAAGERSLRPPAAVVIGVSRCWRSPGRAVQHPADRADGDGRVDHLLFDAAFQPVLLLREHPYGSLSAAMTENSHRPPPRGRPLHRRRGHQSRSRSCSPRSSRTPQPTGIRLKFTIATVVLAVAALACTGSASAHREIVPAGANQVTLRTTLAMVRAQPSAADPVPGRPVPARRLVTMNAVMYYARDVVGGAGYFTLLYLPADGRHDRRGVPGAASRKRFGKRSELHGPGLFAVAGLVVAGLTPMGSLPVARSPSCCTASASAARTR